MAQAWLDSLSEEWVSQPPSENSVSAQAHLRSDDSVKHDATPHLNSKRNGSRIPRFTHGAQNAHSPTRDSSAVLSERSLNDINIPLSRRGPSKLSQEIKPHERGRYSSRSFSASTSNSVVHITVNHKALSASPIRNKGETPEWKRRLVYGDLSYGEQRDLFTSAGAVLENIFKPPAPVPPKSGADDSSEEESRLPQHEVTLPSSPPVYTRDPSTVEIHVEDSAVDDLPDLPDKRAPTAMRYRNTEDSDVSNSNINQSISEEQNPDTFASEEAPSSRNALQPDDNADLRKVSGQTVINEDFSPIMIARHSAEDGKTTFTPVEVPPTELRKRLEKLRRNQKLLMAETEDGLDDSGRYVEDTEDCERLGGFINMRRGGRSSDGSFRNRLLSSTLPDTSELFPDGSVQASTPKQFPTVRMEHWEGTGQSQILTPPFPRAPRPSPDKRGQVQGSSASPLKLFQPYDTFTNQTLLRRLSQFEGQLSEEHASVVQQSVGNVQRDGVYGNASGMEGSLPQGVKPRQPSASVSQFGVGDLDGYEFNEDISFNSNNSNNDAEDDENSSYEPKDNSAQESHPPIFSVTHDSSPLEGDGLVVPRRRKNSASSLSFQSAKVHSLSDEKALPKISLLLPNGDHDLSTPKRRDVGSEGKRPRTSPAKDPTPKRRRTLHKSDIAYKVVDRSAMLRSVQLTHQQMQSVIGKKRKDARHGDLQQLANPNVLAMRQILRPRTPTPSQRSSIQRDRAPSMEEGEAEELFSDPPQPPTAPTPLPVGGVMETDRKPSIKTEDFINEANKIMAMIRSKHGLGSGLASVEESESEHVQPGIEDEESYESTKEPFSRPPSREGRPPLPRMSTRQEDPEIVQHLKQYEEASDMGDIISSSMRSVGIVQSALHVRNERRVQTEEPNGHKPTAIFLTDDELVSDPPGIRISRGKNHGTQKSTESLRDGFLSTGSNGSSSNSTNRSIPTGSSRGSENRKTIAPESVEHLIPDQVGNMVLDRQRNIWIKRKQADSVKSIHNILPSEGSEDDPFADIPDLSVDMTMEMRNLRILNAKKAEEARQAQLESEKDSASPINTPLKTSIKKGTVGPSPLRSILSQMDQDADDAISKLIAPAAREVEIREEEDVEHEIKLHEGRTTAPKKRNLTITFSSPIASVIQDITADRTGTATDEPSFVDKSVDQFSVGSARGRRKASLKSNGKRCTSRSRSGTRLPSRQLSVRGQAFVPRPVSRIDEREEETELQSHSDRAHSNNLEVSIIGDQSVVQQNGEDYRKTSLSFVVTTPARPRDCPAAGIDASNVIADYVGNFSLSPLSDFTIHHPDQSLPLEVSYIVANHHLLTGDHSKRVMSMNTKNLVEKLAEVEPFEPYWEDMRELDIQDKQLASLHQLGEFCGKLVKLDASKNQVRNLAGIPSSVRQLRITHNRLSSLTSWAHLMNLQYVDVSNNELTSLSAFKNLVHLRSLRADNNQLTSLDGIKYHDGLQILRARGNQLEDVDFDNSTLHRLTELDLRSNKIRRLENLDQLPALNALYLDSNELQDLPVKDEKPLMGLKYLSLSDNHLENIDLKAIPNLRLLHVDRNRLTRLTGFSRAQRLDSLSIREQRSDDALDLTFLSGAYEVRKLYLSGNLLSSFDPQIDFLNLQLLELANCGLSELPTNLGQLMPNLRVVNLNFNALSDLAPLRYVPRLKRVLAAGNRLANATSTVETLSGFPHLRVADLRDNPITQGFYAPIRVVVRPGEALDMGDAFVLPDQDREVDARYSRRLDLRTRMRRRIYEKILDDSCAGLRVLDGLPVPKGIGKIRDAVWTALAARGLLVEPNGEKIDLSQCEAGVEVDGTGRWEGEDSFA